MSKNLTIDFKCRQSFEWCLRKGWINDLKNLLVRVKKSGVIPSKQFWKRSMTRILTALNENESTVNEDQIMEFFDRWNRIRKNSQIKFHKFIIDREIIDREIIGKENIGKEVIDQEIIDQEIIDKDIIQDPRHLSVLSGPISFFFYHDLSGRRILLLGDRHVMETICDSNLCHDSNQSNCFTYEVQQWLIDLAQVSPECLDVFCEVNYLTGKKKDPFHVLFRKSLPNKPLKTYKHSLDAVRDQFGPCLLYPKQCPKQLRYHYIDLRYHGFTENPLGLYWEKSIDIQKKMIPLLKVFESLYTSQKRRLIRYLIGSERGQNDEQLFDAYCQSY